MAQKKNVMREKVQAAKDIREGVRVEPGGSASGRRRRGHFGSWALQHSFPARAELRCFWIGFLRCFAVFPTLPSPPNCATRKVVRGSADLCPAVGRPTR
jgi:hypothetical protein